LRRARWSYRKSSTHTEYTTGIVGKLHLQNHQGWFDYDRGGHGGQLAEYRAFLKAQGRSIEGAPNTAAVPGSLFKQEKTPLRVGTSVLPEELYPETWEADQAINFIRQQQGKDQPFFLYLSMLKPHSEFVIPKPFDTMYPGKDLLLPSTFKPGIELPADFTTNAGDEAAKAAAEAPKAGQEAGPSRRRPRVAGSRVHQRPELLKEVMGHYYGAVTMVDKQMGRVLAALEEAGLRDNTVVIFTADHGNMLGERNRMFQGGDVRKLGARTDALPRPGHHAGQGQRRRAGQRHGHADPCWNWPAAGPGGCAGTVDRSPLARRRPRLGPRRRVLLPQRQDGPQGDWKLIVLSAPGPGPRGSVATASSTNVVRDPNERTISTAHPKPPRSRPN